MVLLARMLQCLKISLKMEWPIDSLQKWDLGKKTGRPNSYEKKENFNLFFLLLKCIVHTYNICIILFQRFDGLDSHRGQENDGSRTVRKLHQEHGSQSSKDYPRGL